MSTPSSPPVPYDFRRPNKFNRDHVRALEIVGETFARQFTTVLSTSLRAVPQVQLVRVGQLTYAEYVRETDTPPFLGGIAHHTRPGPPPLPTPPDIALPTVT